MGRKLTPHETALYQRIDKVLHYVWDPIGVAGTPQARDEYDAYLPQVFALLLASKSREEIASCLLNIEERQMGLTRAKQRAEEVAEALLEWSEMLRRKFTEQP